MKATGVIRKVDELGRIVIPKELRDVLGIQI
ncbi:AbrB/MazE/SpoVT family DNA-binding domain-containing protein, partial [Bacillus cereus]